jgi:hypothetical protein
MNPSLIFQLLTRRLPSPFRNKYLLTLFVFGFLLVFIDKHDLWTQLKLRGSVRRLEEDKAYYQGKIEEAKLDKQNIDENKEQFAREKYHMHKRNEEVFIIQKQ